MNRNQVVSFVFGAAAIGEATTAIAFGVPAAMAITLATTASVLTSAAIVAKANQASFGTVVGYCAAVLDTCKINKRALYAGSATGFMAPLAVAYALAAGSPDKEMFSVTNASSKQVPSPSIMIPSPIVGTALQP